MRTTVALFTSFTVFASTSLGLVIVHTHNQPGHSVRDTRIPFSGNWRCKAEAPTIGEQQSMFEFLGAIVGHCQAWHGASKCGQVVLLDLTQYAWQFHTIADVTAGSGIGRAWANEANPPKCPNDNPNGPEQP